MTHLGFSNTRDGTGALSFNYKIVMQFSLVKQYPWKLVNQGERPVRLLAKKPYDIVKKGEHNVL